jgi:hypothetical protein
VPIRARPPTESAGECLTGLTRLSRTRFAGQFVLKGGVLLAAFGERRPTRDIDLQAQAQTTTRRQSRR